MNAKLNITKSFEAVESLMNLQMETIHKSIELQKKSSEELASFFNQEVEKARRLTTADDVMAFNIAYSKALFELLKSQGDTFAAIARDARIAAAEEISKLAA